MTTFGFTFTLQESLNVFLPFFTLHLILAEPFPTALNLQEVFFFFVILQTFLSEEDHVTLHFPAFFKRMVADLSRTSVSFFFDSTGFFTLAASTEFGVRIDAQSVNARSRAVPFFVLPIILIPPISNFFSIIAKNDRNYKSCASQSVAICSSISASLIMVIRPLSNWLVTHSYNFATSGSFFVYSFSPRREYE